MVKRLIALVLVLTSLAGVIFAPAGAEENEEEYCIFWSEDFDKGYSESDASVKNFDKYEVANTVFDDGTTAEVPSFWDGTYNYSTSKNTRDFNTKVVRRVENGNGMMSFQRVGSGTTQEIYIEKTFDEALDPIPELIVEYKVRFTVFSGSYHSFNLRTATGAYPTRIQGPQFSRGYGRILNVNRDLAKEECPVFSYGSAAKPSTKWYTVRVVHSNKTNTRKTYIDGVYYGEADNASAATYYKNGKYSLRFECYCISTGSIVDVDDIKVMTKSSLSSKTPKIMQNGSVVSEYEYSDEPLSVSADVINYSGTEKSATVYFAAYGYDSVGKHSLVASDFAVETVLPGTQKTITTKGLSLPAGVTDIKAFVWENLKPVSPVAIADKATFTSSVNGMPDFTGYKEIGNVSFSVKTGAASTGYTADGLRTYIAMIGTPGYVFEFDTYTGEFLNSYESGSGLQHAIKVGSDGKVYTMPVTGTELWVYDPATGVNTSVEKISVNASHTWHMNYGATNDGEEDRSMLYMPLMGKEYATKGTPVIEYDIDNRKATVYEGFDPGCKYSHAATGDENYVYAASSDSTEVATVSRLDKKTGEMVVYEDEKGRTTGGVTFLKIIGDYIFTRFSSSIVVIDKETMQKVDEFEGGRGQSDCITEPDPLNPDIVYFNSNGGTKLWSYNLKTKERVVAMNTDTVYGNIVRWDFGRWFPDKDGNMGIVGIGGNPDNPGLFHLFPSAQVMKHIYTSLDNNYLGIPTKPSYFYVSRDDILYTGGYEAGLNGFNLKTNELVFTVENGNQHGMTMVDGKLFGGSYGNDAFYMYDPKKPVSRSNPKKIGATSGVNRYYHTTDTNAGFGLSAGIADYGNPEGGVILVTYLDGAPKMKILIGVIPGENILGVEYKNGYIYASSTIRVPQHENEQHDEAHVAKIDARTGETVLMTTVNFDGLPKTTQIGEIRFGPDGLLYGIANAGQTVFALDPDDLSLVKYNSILPDKSPSAGYLGATMILGAEGNFYAAISNDLYCIKPDTLEAQKLYGSSSYFCLDNDGNILKRSGENELSAFNVNKRQRLEIMIQNAEKYYKREEYSAESWDNFSKALSEAKAIDIAAAYLPEISAAARKLSFAIKDLQTVYDYNAGFAFPFK